MPHIFGSEKEFPFELFIYASHERAQSTTILMQKFDAQQIKQFINLFVELLNLICLETSDDARDKVIQINLAMLIIEVIKQFTIYQPVNYTEAFYKYEVDAKAAFYKHFPSEIGQEKVEQSRLALNAHIIKQLPRIASALYSLIRSVLELEQPANNLLDVTQNGFQLFMAEVVNTLFAVKRDQPVNIP